METMVTVWPWSHNGSLSYEQLLKKGWMTGTVNASKRVPTVCPPRNRCPAGVTTLPDDLHGTLVDVTNDDALDYVWSLIEDGYYKHGIRMFWLDGSEPEYFM